MEEEGIYYFFEHSDGSHKMIVANTPQSHTDCPTKKAVEFNAEVGYGEDFKSAVETWYIDHNLRTGVYTLWDDKFELPGKNLEAQKPTRFSLGGNDQLEVYDYPGAYSKRFDGVSKSGGDQPADLQKIFEDNKRTVGIRMEEIDAQYKRINGTSDCASFTAGHRFELQKHPVKENNIQHVLVSVTHDLKQSPAYVTDDVVTDGYRNQFVCMPHGGGHAPFRPERITTKPFVRGGQTAFVVGPPGEEIFTDKYGRVKVQFHWDRDGKIDAESSCWVRVAQSWAYKQWGSMYIPRIGMEVVVDFLEGDPDQPIITGCVYNAESMPPYKLPDEMTKSGIKTNSTKGGNGFNELRFEDKKGSEQIFIHGEKDMDVRIKNDERHWIGNDHHFMVKRDRREQIERDEHRIIKRDQVEKIDRDLHVKIGGKEAMEVGGSLSLKVGGAVAEKFGGNHSEETSGSIYLKSSQTIVLEAGTGLTLKVGGNFITINAAGIQIQGTMVMINSGGAALPGVPGTIVPPTPPQVADPADDAKPGSKWVLEKRSAARKEKTFKPSSGAGGGGGADDKNKEKKHFIKIKLVDEAGKPVPGEAYKITLPDGRVTTGSLDEKGEAEVTGIDPGNCKVTFPNLDKDAWEDS
jgi:type VI secretion system secreted protein VgrG